MHQDAIQMHIEELADDDPLGVAQQSHQCRLGLFVTVGIEHAMDQRQQFSPHLGPDRVG
jgi:hypothetical protein